MDAISDPTFQQTKARGSSTEELPSLLTVVVDLTPKLWAEFDEETKEASNIIKMLRALIVFLNAHLAFNTSNQVAIIASHSQGIKYLYPRSSNRSETEAETVGKKDQFIINPGMYSRFRNVDETLVEELYTLFKQEMGEVEKATQKSTLPGAMLAALAYTNRLLHDYETKSLKSRIMVMTCGNKNGTSQKEEIFQYIPIMNCIFSAAKLKCPIDVVKIGGARKSTFLQQTTDATNGIYLHVDSTDGLVQYLSTAMFIDPSLRSIIVKPNQGSVDFRTSCFLTGKVVAVGYICSVCLCVLSVLPPGNRCPACESEFDERVIAKLKKRPVVAKMSGKSKKRALNP
ncbi:TFIIH/NER complex subunit TFB4 KNAG_0H00770 [Huiozyma naganishii CBS 8797]|uniref:General transcription and DNA repair factor IIH subunit TFB4 n=1 Tax=Huiozyma naganishii (strain ATCC MYA-139 / BCRC 22969 / CBS 8797 / KCTC 17520 / NBRC 10181 / NCYC 3082 / Yp74L-3) TaxID=1071383 RepID=J7S1L0_HUIN7|nr:hypothetical protein KNAG_0H00770 [Kazachstania naganishii CBS 8797]CCK71492.1 hypothetical protein KNAG_0H00770 [Kazachstania naganishii CBS 8797]